MSMAKTLRAVGFFASIVSLVAGSIAGAEERKDAEIKQNAYIDRKLDEQFERYVTSRENRQ